MLYYLSVMRLEIRNYLFWKLRYLKGILTFN